MKKDEAFPPNIASSLNPSAVFPPPDPLVTLEFRNLVLSTYKGLENENADKRVAALRMMSYILFGTFFDEYADKGERRLVTSQEVLAAIEGKESIAYYTSEKFLNWFDANVLPLNIKESSKRNGQARSIAPVIEREIWRALDAMSLNASNQVLFSTGKPPVDSKVKERRVRLEEGQREVMEQTRRDHPARPLVDYLLSQKQVAFKKILRGNEEALIDYIEQIPLKSYEEATSWQSKRGYAKNVARRIYTEYGDVPSLYYNVSTNTPRLSALGVHVHSLPRAARKVALKGAFEFDLSACQLAVIAHLWDVPELKEVLADESRSFWTLMLEHTGLSKDEKPFLKEAVYSTIFGMSRKNVEQRMKDIDWFDDGYAEKFRTHPLIAALFRRRKIKMDELKQSGIMTDAFGRTHKIHIPKSNSIKLSESNHQILRRIMSYQAQSYEIRIMLSIMKVLEKEKQINLLLWLHDGVTLSMSKPSKEEQWIKRLKRVVEEEAKKCKIRTVLECTRI